VVGLVLIKFFSLINFQKLVKVKCLLHGKVTVSRLTDKPSEYITDTKVNSPFHLFTHLSALGGRKLKCIASKSNQQSTLQIFPHSVPVKES